MAERHSHDSDVDIMRLLAAFGVVLIHICDFACFWNVCYNALAHFSVPVFVLISGYYLLDRSLTARQVLTRIARLFGRMLAWAAIYYIFELLRGQAVFAPKEAVRYLLTQPTHLWYQYALITLLLFTPALHIFTTHAEKGLYRYVLALTFALGSLVLIALRSGRFPLLQTVTDKMKLPYTQGFVFLYLLGGYFRRFGIERPGLWYLLGGLGFAGTALFSVLLPYAQATSLVLSFFSPGPIAMGIAVFVLCRQLFAEHSFSERAGRLLKNAAADTEGVYYIHILLITLLKPVLAAMVKGLPRLVQVPLKTLFIFSLSMALIALLRRIPGVNWLCGTDRKKSVR